MPTTKVFTQFQGADHRPPILLTGNTSHATPGTRSNHAHGLGYTPKGAIAIPTAANADGALTANVGEIAIVAITATNVTVRALVASAPFDLLIF